MEQLSIEHGTAKCIYVPTYLISQTHSHLTKHKIQKHSTYIAVVELEY